MRVTIGGAELKLARPLSRFLKTVVVPGVGGPAYPPNKSEPTRLGARGSGEGVNR